jgi:Caspase domain
MKRHALVVGINSYPSLLGGNLNTPASSANAIAEILKKYGRFQSIDRLPITGEGGEFSVNPNPNAKGMVKSDQLKDLIQKLFLYQGGENIPETVLLFFAGHGRPQKYSEDVTEGFLETSDSTREEIKGASIAWLRNIILKQSSVQQQIIWLDCCYSGELLKFAETEMSHVPKGGSRLVITACWESQTAKSSPKGNYGLLTEALLEGLIQFSDGVVTATALCEFVEQKLKGAPQEPICRLYGEDFYLTWLEPTPKDNHQHLKGLCPYCNYKISIEKPEPDQLVNDFEFLPYSRDIGRFDNGEWTKIGEDYYKTINFDKIIGILRVNNNHLIYYKVAECPSCKYKFDVFANLTPNQKLSNIWPHLLEIDRKDINSVIEHNLKNCFLAFIDPIKKFLDNSLFFTILSLVFVLSIILIVPSFIVEKHDFFPFSFIKSFSLKFVGLFFIGIFIHNIYSYINIFKNVEHFTDLFKVTHKKGVIYWRNFTLCRFVGYQKTGKISITQSELIAAVPSIIFLLVFWSVSKLRNGFNVYLDIAELIFWILLIYCMSVNIHYSLSTSRYVLTTMVAIPNKINSKETLSLFKPFWDVVNQSASSIASVCTFLILIFYVTDYLKIVGFSTRETDWLISAFGWSFITTLSLLSTLRGLRKLSIITAIYAAGLIILSSNVRFSWINNRNAILFTGILLSMLMFAHYLWIRGYVYKASKKCKEDISKQINREINDIEQQVEDTRKKINSDSEAPQKITTLLELKKERKDSLDRLDKDHTLKNLPKTVNTLIWFVPSLVVLFLYILNLQIKI